MIGWILRLVDQIGSRKCKQGFILLTAHKMQWCDWFIERVIIGMITKNAIWAKSQVFSDLVTKVGFGFVKLILGSGFWCGNSI